MRQALDQAPAANPATPSTAAPRGLARALGAPTLLRARDLMISAQWPLRRIGPRRGIALAALLAAAAAALIVVRPIRESAAALELQIERGAAARPARARDDRAERPLDLPRVGQLPAIVGTLVTNARASGLELESGTYRLIHAKGGGPSRYEIGLPLSGPYPRVRQFVEASLASVPALALDGMTLERPEVASPVVDVQVRFVVFVAEGA